MHKLLEYIDDTMQEYEDKVARGGELSSKDVECIKDLAKTKMAILTNEAMESEGGYSERYSREGDMNNGYSGRGRMYYDGGNSYAGRRRNVRRDSMRRNSRDGGYSYAREDMVEDLRELMMDAPDEQTRQEFQRFISKVEKM